MTTPLTTQVCDDIKTTGYTLCKNVISDLLLSRISSWLDVYETNFQVDSADPFHGYALVINNLHAKNILFWELISHPLIVSICDNLLNQYSYSNCEGFSLTGSAIRSVYGQEAAQQLHIDSNLPGCNHILSLQFCIPLDPFTPDNGSTQIIPGSHTIAEYPPPNNLLSLSQKSKLLHIVALPGDILIFNAGIWHGAGEKLTAGRRAAVFLNYSRWFIKQSFDIPNNMPSEIASQLTDSQFRIAGNYYQPPYDEREGRGRKSQSPVIRKYLDI